MSIYIFKISYVDRYLGRYFFKWRRNGEINFEKILLEILFIIIKYRYIIWNVINVIFDFW